MRVAVRYVAQARHAAGVLAEEVELDRPCTVEEFVVRLADRREALRPLLVADGGGVRPTVLLFVGEEQVEPRRALRDGDVVTVLSPMAGG